MGREMATDGGVRYGAAESIAQRLSGSSDLYLPHSIFEARAVSQQEKKDHLVGLLNRDPAIFLERYGKHLSASELDAFDVLQNDYEVEWHLKRLKAAINPSELDRKNRAASVRNRRLAFMEKLVEQGSYFSEDEMRMRSPLLHHEYVGQFQDPSSRGFARRGERFADMLIRQADEAFIQKKLKEERKQAGIVEEVPKNQSMEEQEEEEEEEDDDDDDDDEETNGATEAQQPRTKEEKLQDFAREMEEKFLAEEDKPSIPDEELRQKMEDFTRLMQEKFLDGEDSEHVDYRSIDENVALDDHWLSEVAEDAEAKYFEED